MMMMSDLFISFSYSCARISHVWRESDSHTVTTSKNLLLQNAINHRGLYTAQRSPTHGARDLTAKY